MLRSAVIRPLLLALSLVLLAVGADGVPLQSGTARAQIVTFEVTDSGDSGAGTLRDAIL